MNYLYLLKFKNNKYFKIGVSSNNYNRIINHQKQYNLNIEESLIFKGSKRDVSVVEKMLLTAIKPSESINEEYRTADGHTEIREIDYFDDALEIIESNEKYFKLKKIGLDKKILNGEKPIKKTKKITSYKHDNLSNLESFIISFKHILTNIISSIERKPDNIYEIYLDGNRIDYNTISKFRTSVCMTHDRRFSIRAYGMESAVGYEEDKYKKIKFNMPDMIKYGYLTCNEYDSLFLGKYQNFCLYLNNLVK